MKYFLYSIYDRVSGSYGEPFLAINEQVAKRRFDFLMSQAPMINKDCELYLIGGFDAESGDIFPDKKFVANYVVDGGKEN